MPKAIRFNQLGGPEVLHFEDPPARQPGTGEALLKVEAVGLNRAESMYYHGAYMETVSLPSGLGYEALGKVIAVGDKVDAALIGKRFGSIPGFSMNRYPALAEEAVVPASALAAVPESYLYGGLSGKPTPFPMAAFGRTIGVFGYTFGELRGTPEWETMKKYIYGHLAGGSFKPKISRTFPFDQTVEAYRYLEGNEQVGKVVVTM